MAFVAIPSVLATDDPLIITIVKFILNALLLQSWIPNADFAYSFNGVSWYLSATLLFSFLSPLIVKAINTLKWRSSLTFLGVILFVQAAIAYCPTPGLGLFVYVFPPIRLLDCIAGCLLYKLSRDFHDGCKRWLINGVLVISVLSVAGLLAVYNTVLDLIFFGPLFRTTVWSVPAWGIVLALSCEDKLAKPLHCIFAGRPVVWLGGITFEFYLLHKVILNCGKEGYRLLLHRQPDLLMVIIGFAVSLGISVGLHLLDKYIRKKLREKKLNQQ